MLSVPKSAIPNPFKNKNPRRRSASQPSQFGVPGRDYILPTVNVEILTNLVTKYKAVLLANPEVFIIVFFIAWTLAWVLGGIIYRGRIETANDRAVFQKERAEHFRERAEAADKQLLRTFTPPDLDVQSH
jgi:hypothetical protein